MTKTYPPKVAIVTIVDNNNYGNRLQNYAVQFVLEKRLGLKAITLKNNEYSNSSRYFLLRCIKNCFGIFINTYSQNDARRKSFEDFNKLINFSKKKAYPYFHNDYDYGVVGSDQVWNPEFGRLRDVDLLTFIEPGKRIAYSASFGINDIPIKSQEYIGDKLKYFKAISVREDSGADIVYKAINKKIPVLIDPTMMLKKEEWLNIAKKPKDLDNDKEYVVTYFLGDKPLAITQKIEKLVSQNNVRVYNFNDLNDSIYTVGPSEFIYLISNAKIVVTDSFHACVFSILFNKPFIVCKREGKANNLQSRIDSLLSKFGLEQRNENVVDWENPFQVDYTNVDDILSKERDKTFVFLKKAFSD